ncbi:hypothetical protein M8C21_013448, partial [Ambrosia artemisiifolia]
VKAFFSLRQLPMLSTMFLQIWEEVSSSFVYIHTYFFFGLREQQEPLPTAAKLNRNPNNTVQRFLLLFLSPWLGDDDCDFLAFNGTTPVKMWWYFFSPGNDGDGVTARVPNKAFVSPITLHSAIREKNEQGHVINGFQPMSILDAIPFVPLIPAADLEEVTTLFAAFLSIHHIQMAIKNESPYWRGRAATTIQVAWRYRRKRRNLAATSRSGSTYPSNKLSFLILHIALKEKMILNGNHMLDFITVV